MRAVQIKSCQLLTQNSITVRKYSKWEIFDCSYLPECRTLAFVDQPSLV